MNPNEDLRTLVSLLEGAANSAVRSTKSVDEILREENFKLIFSTKAISTQMWKTFSTHGLTSKPPNPLSISKERKKNKIGPEKTAITVDRFMRMIKDISAPWYFKF